VRFLRNTHRCEGAGVPGGGIFTTKDTKYTKGGGAVRKKGNRKVARERREGTERRRRNSGGRETWAGRRIGLTTKDTKHTKRGGR